MRPSLRSIAVALVVLGSACDGSAGPGGPTLPGEPLDQTPVGASAVATIGPAGGTLASLDGRLTLVFPAGALAADTAIEVQEIAVPGGRGWILEPEGLALAMPVAATVTLGVTEAGTPTRERVGEDEVVALPMPHFVHAPLTDAPFADVDVTPTWREADGELDYAFELPHFSLVAYLEAGEQSLGTRATVPLDSPFRVVVAQRSAPMPVALLFRCGTEIRRATFNVAFLPDWAMLVDNDQVQPTGTAGFSFDNTAVDTECRCRALGLDAFVISTPLRPITPESRRPQLEGCQLDESVVTVRRPLTVECAARLCIASDPVDMPMPDGDPSLDLVCVTTGTTTAEQPWVRVVFAGPWQPSSTFYSWFARVRFGGAAGEIGDYLVEHHAGGDRMLAENGLPPTVFELETSGFRLYLPSSLVGMITTITVESGIQKTPTAAFVPDGISAFAFDATERNP